MTVPVPVGWEWGKKGLIKGHRRHPPAPAQPTSSIVSSRSGRFMPARSTCFRANTLPSAAKKTCMHTMHYTCGAVPAGDRATHTHFRTALYTEPKEPLARYCRSKSSCIHIAVVWWWRNPTKGLRQLAAQHHSPP